MPLILALISEGGDDKFQASTGYIVKLFFLKKPTKYMQKSQSSWNCSFYVYALRGHMMVFARVWILREKRPVWGSRLGP